MENWKVGEKKVETWSYAEGEEIPDDLFVVCASYEPRTITCSGSLSDKYNAKRALIYVNEEFLEGSAKPKVESNLDLLTKNLKAHSGDVQIARGSWLDPVKQFQILREHLEPRELGSSTTAKVTIDITTFNREALLCCVSLLRSLYVTTHIRTVYVSPIDHGPWLSRGFRLVRNVIGFPGIQDPENGTLVMGLSGFESDRLIKIVEEYEPRKLLLGIGDPPTDKNFLERNISEQKLALARQDVEEFRFPTSDIQSCLNLLEKVVELYIGQYNIILAPLSPKPSTLAALLLAERHREILLAYCVPGEYNVENYSTGAAGIYIDHVPVDNKSTETG